MMLLKYWRTTLNAALITLLLLAMWRGHAMQTRYETAQRQHEQAVAAANEAARTKELTMQNKMVQARKEFDDELQKRDIAYRNLHTESERLRYVLSGRAKTGATGTTAGDDASAQTERLVLGQCIAEYEALARDADELNSRLSIAQKWAKAVEGK